MNKKQLVEYINNYIIQLNTLLIAHNFNAINLQELSVNKLKEISKDCQTLFNIYNAEQAIIKSNENFENIISLLDSVIIRDSPKKFYALQEKIISDFKKIIEFNNKLKSEARPIKSKIFDLNINDIKNIHVCPTCKKAYVFQTTNKSYLECCSVECEIPKHKEMKAELKKLRNLVETHFSWIETDNYIISPTKFYNLPTKKKFAVTKNIINTMPEFITNTAEILFKHNINDENEIISLSNQCKERAKQLVNSNLTCTNDITIIAELNDIINEILFSLKSDSLFKGCGEFVLSLNENMIPAAYAPNAAEETKTRKKTRKTKGDLFDFNTNQSFEVKSMQTGASGALVDNRNAHRNINFKNESEFNKTEDELYKNYFKNNIDILNIINQYSEFGYNLNEKNSVPNKIYQYMIDNSNKYNNNDIKQFVTDRIFIPFYGNDIAELLPANINYKERKFFDAAILILMIYFYIKKDVELSNFNMIFKSVNYTLIIKNIDNIISDINQVRKLADILISENLKVNYPYCRGGQYDRNKDWAGGLQCI